jgi:hypothetical protein
VLLGDAPVAIGTWKSKKGDAYDYFASMGPRSADRGNASRVGGNDRGNGVDWNDANFYTVMPLVSAATIAEITAARPWAG